MRSVDATTILLGAVPNLAPWQNNSESVLRYCGPEKLRAIPHQLHAVPQRGSKQVRAADAGGDEDHLAGVHGHPGGKARRLEAQHDPERTGNFRR